MDKRLKHMAQQTQVMETMHHLQTQEQFLQTTEPLFKVKNQFKTIHLSQCLQRKDPWWNAAESWQLIID